MDKRYHFTSLFISFLILFTRALNADYQAGLDAYMTGDYDTAIGEWQAVVESPPDTVPPAVRAETLYAIGILFWTGMGVEQDIYESASWLVLAAEIDQRSGVGDDRGLVAGRSHGSLGCLGGGAVGGGDQDAIHSYE